MLHMLRKKKPGMFDNFIFVIIGMVALLTVVAVTLPILKEFTIWYDLYDVQRGALFRCEADGGLTDSTNQLILDTLSKDGLDTSKITVLCNLSADSGVDPDSTFGDNITMQISYTYSYQTVTLTDLFTGHEQTVTKVINSPKSSTTSKA